MAKKLGIQTKGTGRAAMQGGGMAPVGGAARRDMRSGYYTSDMGMRGGPMYNKGGRVGLRDRAFAKGGKVSEAKKKPTHKPVKGTFKRKKGLKPGSLEYWQHSVQTPKRKGGRVGLKHAGPVAKLFGADKGWEKRDKMTAEAAHEKAKQGKKQKTFFSDTGKSQGKGHRVADDARNRKAFKKHIKKAKAKAKKK